MVRRAKNRNTGSTVEFVQWQFYNGREVTEFCTSAQLPDTAELYPNQTCAVKMLVPQLDGPRARVIKLSAEVEDVIVRDELGYYGVYKPRDFMRRYQILDRPREAGRTVAAAASQRPARTGMAPKTRYGVEERKEEGKLMERETVLYGDSNTVHSTEHLDVETDAAGRVVAVWFRCMQLPFSQTAVDPRRAHEMRLSYGSEHNEKKRILAVKVEIPVLHARTEKPAQTARKWWQFWRKHEG